MCESRKKQNERCERNNKQCKQYHCWFNYSCTRALTYPNGTGSGVAWEIVYVCGRRRLRKSLLSRWFTRLWASQAFPRSELPCVLRLTLYVHRHVGNTPKTLQKGQALLGMSEKCTSSMYSLWMLSVHNYKTTIWRFGSVIFLMFLTKKKHLSSSRLHLFLKIQLKQ